MVRVALGFLLTRPVSLFARVNTRSEFQQPEVSL